MKDSTFLTDGIGVGRCLSGRSAVLRTMPCFTVMAVPAAATIAEVSRG